LYCGVIRALSETAMPNNSTTLPPHWPQEADLLHILVVDDDESQRFCIKESLAWRGFSVTAVAGAQEALALCRDAPPDLIMSDWCLGRNSPSGINILKALRSQEATKNIPFIMMSCIKKSPEDEALVRRLGGDLFVTKFEIVALEPLGEAFARHVRALVLGRRQPVEKVATASQRRNGQSSLKQPSPQNCLTIGRVTADFGGRKAFVDGADIGLTPMEFNLLAHLAENHPRVIGWEELCISRLSMQPSSRCNLLTISKSTPRPGFDLRGPYGNVPGCNASPSLPAWL